MLPVMSRRHHNPQRGIDCANCRLLIDTFTANIMRFPNAWSWLQLQFLRLHFTGRTRMRDRLRSKRIIEVGFSTDSNRSFRTKSLEGNGAGIVDMRSVFMVRKWASVRPHNAGVTTTQRGQRQRQRQRRGPTAGWRIPVLLNRDYSRRRMRLHILRLVKPYSPKVLTFWSINRIGIFFW